MDPSCVAYPPSAVRLPVPPWIGLDIGKTEHFADVLDAAGSPLFAVAVANDEADIEALIARAESFGSSALVVDQPGSLARLVLAVAARRGVPVAYVPGLVMRRAADLYPGESKTDRRDAFVLADTGRTRRHQVHWLDAGNDELLEQLRVLNGYDTGRRCADGGRASRAGRSRWPTSRACPRQCGGVGECANEWRLALEPRWFYLAKEMVPRKDLKTSSLFGAASRCVNNSAKPRLRGSTICT